MEFEEKQGLKIWWLYLITGLTILPTVLILGFYQDGPSLQDLKKMYFAPVLALFLPFLIIFIIQKNQLTLTINSKGFSYRYFPFQRKSRTYHWEHIEAAYVRKYDAFSEYGGYGVKHRLWFNFKDKAYLMNDKSRGFQINFRNGKKLLFSSNKVDELELFLINLKIRYNIQAIR
ncbi:hypothetical protein QWY86_01945 [Pedobacter aquatilis]|uniref:hypothetical protein n=1 Tax=Pedobacter aquatilis TaxID=351343 RepID=UPI0025B415C9|nr:hypothetical protein [Pedobacter aquatilis]MDN3585411.1 hypothetical protein [Pedobacter aquatilis]